MSSNEDDFYDEISTKIFGDDTRFRFMNHGYYPVDARVAGQTDLETAASLYLQCMSYVDTPGTLLEVACGRGGGSDLISKLYDTKVHACDYNIKNIEFCRYQLQNDVDYRFGSATSLPYDDKMFDTVINIEATSCYCENVEDAFAEIYRVLKPGGKFIFSDIVIKGIHTLETLLDKYFRIDKHIDITENAYLSCLYSPIWWERNNDTGFQFLKQLYSEKCPLYKSREHTYHIFVLTKE